MVLFECLAIDARKKAITVLPDEDEVFRIAGGAGRIIDALQNRHAAAVSLRHRLTSVDSADGKTYALTFETPEGPKKIEADYVVMALPMTALRTIGVTMPGRRLFLGRRLLQPPFPRLHERLRRSRPRRRARHRANVREIGPPLRRTAAYPQLIPIVDNWGQKA